MDVDPQSEFARFITCLERECVFVGKFGQMGPNLRGVTVTTLVALLLTLLTASEILQSLLGRFCEFYLDFRVRLRIGNCATG